MKKIIGYTFQAIVTLIAAIVMSFIKVSIWGNFAVAGFAVTSITSGYTAVKLYRMERCKNKEIDQ